MKSQHWVLLLWILFRILLDWLVYSSFTLIANNFLSPLPHAPDYSTPRYVLKYVSLYLSYAMCSVGIGSFAAILPSSFGATSAWSSLITLLSHLSTGIPLTFRSNPDLFSWRWEHDQSLFVTSYQEQVLENYRGPTTLTCKRYGPQL